MPRAAARPPPRAARGCPWPAADTPRTAPGRSGGPDVGERAGSAGSPRGAPGCTPRRRSWPAQDAVDQARERLTECRAEALAHVHVHLADALGGGDRGLALDDLDAADDRQQLLLLGLAVGVIL